MKPIEQPQRIGRRAFLAGVSATAAVTAFGQQRDNLLALYIDCAGRGTDTRVEAVSGAAARVVAIENGPGRSGRRE